MVNQFLLNMYTFWILLFLAAWVLLSLLVFLKYFRDIRCIINEPVFRFPIVVIESDDWSPGPLDQVAALTKIRSILERHVDNDGFHPVVSVGVVLSAVKMDSLCSSEPVVNRLYFDTEPFSPIMNALIHGEKAGFYEIHLHGMDHFWQGSLEQYAKTNNEIFRQKCSGDSYLRNECLPPPLQSRWAACDELPCKNIENGQVAEAVLGETAEFYRIFDRSAEVVVPPTFLWTRSVEKYWSENSVAVIVTPGCRFTSRDKNGRMVADLERIYNGMTTEFGQTYMVRNGYFEPGMGHTASSALDYVKNSKFYGRPCLIESHRFNYISNNESYDAYAELEKFYTILRAEFPDLKFSSTSELAKAACNKKHRLVSKMMLFRVIVWMRRIFILPGFKKLTLYSGMAIAWYGMYFFLSLCLWVKQRSFSTRTE